MIIASRNLQKSVAVKQEIENLTGNKNVCFQNKVVKYNKIPVTVRYVFQIQVLKLDLEDFDSVQDFANILKNNKTNIDFLINNAG